MASKLSNDEFIGVLEKHRDEFYRYVYRSVWDTGVAEDVFSSAVLAAYENLAKFTPGTNFRAWMFRIITNKCYVANRETARTPDALDESKTELAVLHEKPEYGDVLDDPKTFLEQCGDEVYRAFRKLSTPQRSCILLRDLERFSYKEIAEILEIPSGTVMTHLSRGRTKLRQELLEYAQEVGIVRNYPKIVPKLSPESSQREAKS